MLCEKCGQEFPSRFDFKEGLALSICTSCFEAIGSEEQQSQVAQAPDVPVKRGSPSIRRKALLLASAVLIVCVIGFFLLPLLNPSEDSLIIVNGENTSVRGKVLIQYDYDANRYEPEIVKAGRLVLFRTDQIFHGGSGKAGEAYRWDKELKLKKVGKFDLRKTDEELFERYGLKAMAK